MALLGVDIGGTKIALGLANEQGAVIAQDRFLVAETKTAEQSLDRVADMARRLSAEHHQPITQIGIGSPGPFHDGRLTQSANLPGWDGVDLAGSLSGRLNAPAHLQNDANAAAIGEWMFGQGQHTSHMAYITISTGVGAGLVLNGAPYGGPHGNAAEIGHIVIDTRGPQCNCGLTGCLEAMASGTAMGRVGRQRASSSAFLKGRPSDSIGAKDVIEGWRQGDGVCTEIVGQIAQYLGHGLGILINLVNPERIVLGGGVMNAGQPLLVLIQHWTEVYSMPTLFRETDIVLSSLGDDTGLMGAIAVAMVGAQQGA
jgi:glucokinase